ncbi:MAG: hypothetical protein V4573_01695, partial [Pseudomonadota bacterium]
RRVVSDPGWTEHRKVPAAKRRDDEQGRLFFWLLCFWRSKRKVTCRRATPGLVAERNANLSKNLKASQNTH